jgi:hypothetical protein
MCRYAPPPNFAKEVDTRYAARRVDALSPTVIADLICAQIDDMIDLSKWRKREPAGRRNRALLDRVSKIGPRSRKQWRARRSSGVRKGNAYPSSEHPVAMATSNGSCSRS